MHICIYIIYACFVYRVSILSCVVPHGNNSTTVSGAFSVLIKKLLVTESHKVLSKKGDLTDSSSESKPIDFVLVNKQATAEPQSEKHVVESSDISASEAIQIIKEIPNTTKIAKPNETQTEQEDAKSDFASANYLVRSNATFDGQTDGVANETLSEFHQTISKSTQGSVCEKHSEESQHGVSQFKKLEEDSPEKPDVSLNLRADAVEKVETPADNSKPTAEPEPTFEVKEAELKRQNPAVDENLEEDEDTSASEQQFVSLFRKFCLFCS